MNTTKVLPIELKQKIFEYLNNQDLLYLRATSKYWHKYIDDISRQLCYSVGKPIALYSKISLIADSIFCGGDGRVPSFKSSLINPRTSFTKEEVENSLVRKDKTILLFNNAKDAFKFCEISTSEYLDKNLDAMFTYEKPATFVIQINNNLLIKPRRFEYGPIISTPFGLRRNSLNLFCTPASNCESIYYADFKPYLRFFNVSETKDTKKVTDINEMKILPVGFRNK